VFRVPFLSDRPQVQVRRELFLNQCDLGVVSLFLLEQLLLRIELNRVFLVLLQHIVDLVHSPSN
jgi:hypothetical protein